MIATSQPTFDWGNPRWSFSFEADAGLWFSTSYLVFSSSVWMAIARALVRFVLRRLPGVRSVF